MQHHTASLCVWRGCVVCCRETLRRDPVVGGVMRVSTREFALGDYHVPASQTFLLPLRHLAAHDPRWEGKEGGMSCLEGSDAIVCSVLRV